LPLTSSELLSRADDALMLAKREGRRGGVALASDAAQSADAEPAPVSRLQRGRPPTAARLWPDTTEQTAALRKRTRQLVLANALGARLSTITDVQEILDAAVEELNRAFGYYLCSIIRIREDGHVESAAARGEAFRELTGRRWTQPMGDGVIGRCLRERRPMIVPDVAEDPDYHHTPETTAVRCEVCVPLFVDGRLWGAINLEDIEARALEEDDARLLATIAAQVGAALRSARLYDELVRLRRTAV